MRNVMKSARVKRDYLNRLGSEWYRGDTNQAHSNHFSVRSSA